MKSNPPMSGAAVIDPLGSGVPGRYRDELVTVVHEPRAADCDNLPPTVVRTPHFRLRRDRHGVWVDHRLDPPELDNSIAGHIASELFAPGWLNGAEVFERVFTGVVRSTLDDPVEAWSTFYDNTLRRIRYEWHVDPVGSEGGHSISAMLPVYRRVLELVGPGRVLDIGSCFGFLALLLIERNGNSVVASDIAGGTITLLRTIARERGVSMGTLVCDGARVPLPSKAVDTVTVVHLLEHLEPEHGGQVLAEAVRLARHRVVVAVPFEDEPTAAYGHVRTFETSDLVRLGRGCGFPFQVEQHHGGWLLIDTD